MFWQLSNMHRFLIIPFLIWVVFMDVAAQNVINDGTTVTILAATTVTMDDLGYANQTNGIDGVIDNDGTIQIDGDWNNNAVAGDVFINLNGTGAAVFTGTAAQGLGGSRTTGFENLTINNTSATGVTLDEAITVNNALTMTDGILFTDATNLLTIVAGGSSNDGNAGSYVDGPLRKIGSTDFIFPSGDGTVWAPIEVTSLTSSTEFTAEYFFADFGDPDVTAPLNNASLIEYWTLDQMGTPANANVTLHYKDASRSDITDFMSADLVVAQFNSVSSMWENRGQSSRTDTDPGSITSDPVTSFSPFTFGSLSAAENPLPVEFLSFEARINEDVVDLFWSTASEKNNDFFSVERTTDLQEYEAIDKVNGAGDSDEIQRYSSTDPQPHPGRSFYRIRQTDFDGTSSFTQLVSVDLLNGAPNLILFPNPSEGESLNFDIQGVSTTPIFLEIHDMDGKQLYEKAIIVEEMPLTLAETELDLQSGIYLIKVAGENFQFQRKLVILD